MSILDTAPELRDVWRAHQEAVAAIRAAPCDITAHLATLPAGLTPHPLRDSRGERWVVTKISTLLYLVSNGQRCAECRTAGEVVAVMEGDHG